MVYVVGVDVGSASVRAGLIKAGEGKVLKQSKEPIRIRKHTEHHVEQSSADIWQAVCKVVKNVVENVEEEVVGLGFDATCSLVATPHNNEHPPSVASVAEDGEAPWDIIMWMDHRAEHEAEEVNKTGHRVLEYVGGKVSPEMQIPKLKWLKTHKSPEWWDSIAYFHDLPDWLTYKSTGSVSRSMCSVVCKWNFLNDIDAQGWSKSFLTETGLYSEEFIEKIGCSESVRHIGEKIGELSEQCKSDFGLPPSSNIAVGTSLIDAHAGGLALCNDGQSRLAVIAGTSACFMAVHTNKINLPGIWGPYKDAMIPGTWLHEGGMSAMGSVLDHVMTMHPAYDGLKDRADLHSYLTSYFPDPVGEVVRRGVHVYPDFLGNRSPMADPTLKGSIVGLTLDTGVDSLAALFAACVMSLAYGVRHVSDALVDGGYKLESFIIAGGIASNPIFTHTLADCTALRVHCVPGGDAMLLGCGIAASTAAGLYPDIKTAQEAHAPDFTTVVRVPEKAGVHEKRYAVFKEMLKDQMKYTKMME